ncbi:hypothetical protein KAI54_01730, partial [Candidatus Gracilibacteria bacterium]|nr:hypothetical protein [Candidatus Gracilibacteria bacterium]
IAEFMQENPDTRLAELKAEDFTQNPELQNDWKNILEDVLKGMEMDTELKNPKFNVCKPETWKNVSAGEAIQKFVKKQPEIAAAAALGLGITAIVLLLSKSKITKVAGGITGFLAGILGFELWGAGIRKKVGEIASSSLEKIGIDKETQKKATNKYHQIFGVAENEDLNNKPSNPIETAQEKSEALLGQIPMSEETKKRLEELKKSLSKENVRKLFASIVEKDGPIVVENGKAFILNSLGDLVDLEKWIFFQYASSAKKVFEARDKDELKIGSVIVQYVQEMPKFCFIFWTSDRILNFFRKVPVGWCRSLMKGAGWGYTVPAKIFQAGKLIKAGTLTFKGSKIIYKGSALSFSAAKKAINASKKSRVVKKIAKKGIDVAKKGAGFSKETLKKSVSKLPHLKVLRQKLIAILAKGKAPKEALKQIIKLLPKPVQITVAGAASLGTAAITAIIWDAVFPEKAGATNEAELLKRSSILHQEFGQQELPVEHAWWINREDRKDKLSELNESQKLKITKAIHATNARIEKELPCTPLFEIPPELETY